MRMISLYCYLLLFLFLYSLSPCNKPFKLTGTQFFSPYSTKIHCVGPFGLRPDQRGSSQLKPCPYNAVYQDLSLQLGKVASAIEKISENQLNFGSLYEEVMKMDGFEENMLASAFDCLNGDEKQARSFMLKNDKLRRQWLQNFFDNYLSQF